MTSDRSLSSGWGIAWRTALASSGIIVALCLSLQRFAHLPTGTLIFVAGATGLTIGSRLPAARPGWARRSRVSA